ncbi:adenylate/guanylate cyclase domain-containing protein [Hymenobacter sp. BT664]|uniref:Adenylate/guanylate cyclase domain-containing protein n=1 Tax=Hymenobacter montanus TaxID=2771359 RepID=A0A927BBS8_9BACT|nr:adenylate/guanylate cyclase domain-containing protein [Hymenobacter montanus]MBD2767870.1 adenylate/guanylate cyclase domain-containing protein [Hymenobacter montanus]
MWRRGAPVWQRIHTAWRNPLERYRLRAELLVAVAFMVQLQLLALLAKGPDGFRFVGILGLGLAAGLLIGLLEVRVFPRALGRARLPVAIVCGALLHLLVLTLFVRLQLGAVELLRRLPESGLAAAAIRDRQAVAGTWGFTQVLLAYGLAMLNTTVLYQTSRVIGPRVLAGLLLGRYHRPVAEHRIFLFLDVKNSTGLAEQLGEQRYSRLISDFFYDLSAAVVASRGEIYQYVGDEAVITWPTATGSEQARCLSCFFAFDAAITRRQAYYLSQYGVVPAFKGGAHLGRVMATQVGDIKRDVVYHGDVLNTTARIQAQCNALHSRLLISEELRQRLGAIPEFRLMLLGQIALRGKQQPVQLVDVQPATQEGK